MAIKIVEKNLEKITKRKLKVGIKKTAKIVRAIKYLNVNNQDI